MFYFAWVDASETAFDPTIHNREDEDMFGFSVEHAEGEFAGLEIEIKNPRISLLAPARKVHAWMSCVSRERDEISATRSRNWRNPSVLRASRERTVSLVRAGSLLRLGTHLPPLKVLPVDFPSPPWPVGILTLKNRTLNPVAKLFIECAREVAKPLAAHRVPNKRAKTISVKNFAKA